MFICAIRTAGSTSSAIIISPRIVGTATCYDTCVIVVCQVCKQGTKCGLSWTDVNTFISCRIVHERTSCHAWLISIIFAKTPSTGKLTWKCKIIDISHLGICGADRLATHCGWVLVALISTIISARRFAYSCNCYITVVTRTLAETNTFSSWSCSRVTKIPIINQRSRTNIDTYSGAIPSKGWTRASSNTHPGCIIAIVTWACIANLLTFTCKVISPSAFRALTQWSCNANSGELVTPSSRCRCGRCANWDTSSIGINLSKSATGASKHTCVSVRISKC